jgi:hypothetical protein
MRMNLNERRYKLVQAASTLLTANHSLLFFKRRHATSRTEPLAAHPERKLFRARRACLGHVTFAQASGKTVHQLHIPAHASQPALYDYKLVTALRAKHNL